MSSSASRYIDTSGGEDAATGPILIIIVKFRGRGPSDGEREPQVAVRSVDGLTRENVAVDGRVHIAAADDAAHNAIAEEFRPGQHRAHTQGACRL
jgi:hypothetical protein